MHNTPIDIVIKLYDQYSPTAKELRQQELDTIRIELSFGGMKNDR